MSNSKKTVKSEFSNMYGNEKNLNIGKNKSTNELLNNIKNSDLNKNLNLNTNIGSNQTETQRIERKASLTIPEIATIGMNASPQSPFKFLYIIIILIIVMIIGLLFYYKDLFMYYFDILFSNTPTREVKDTNEENPIKSDVTHEKVEVTHAKVESTSAKIDDLDKKVDKLIDSKTCSNNSPSTINTLNDKINNVSPYKEANVTADGFCYIGYDNGQRECMEAYAGDVCMSGEIFPSLDICINPKLRP